MKALVGIFNMDIMDKAFLRALSNSRCPVDSSTHQTTDRSTVQEEHDFLIHEMKSDPTLSAPIIFFLNWVLKMKSVQVKPIIL